MKIRNRLSIQYTLTFAAILLLVLSSIFLIVERNRKSDFYNRLTDRAYTVGQLFLAEDNLSKEKFEEVQKKYPLYLPHESVNIYDAQYNPVFINQKSSQWPRATVENVVNQRHVQYESDGVQNVGIYYEDNSGNFVVLVSAFDQYGYDRRRQLFWILTFSFTISVVVMFFLGQWFAWTALAPITKAIREVKFRSTSLNRRLQSRASKDEINELVTTFNNLLEHLEQSFDAQRSFVNNASHELRTPLTSIIGNIEVTLAFDRSVDEYKATLKSVLSVTEKLNELVNSLFELAQTTINVSDFEDVRLDELIWQVKDEWMNKVAGSEIELVYNLVADTDKFTIKGKPDLLYIALGNILNNAIKFSGNKPVQCVIESKPDATVIRIRDQGIGVSPDVIGDIYKPFRRGANALEFSGLGIGLSLTEKILLLHNATISINADYKDGAEFVISFPVGG